ncbi:MULTISPECIES: NUDIX hydrolase [Mycolicibacter]|uniref:NUDIX hydrolase n=2 Tax=Mycolicibacter TaxID=1073531 RepID=A0ABU5XN55_9MYCO|nr:MULTISPECIES: NUDIX hydrolase [unclassified Mycolicibacter]MEB3023418.1 NUDIX hydrolase [Mycolicibacter sp. MYC098]MEB3033760.1 NUDIX hydrolase [Mycolicibacter sp. MYC340]
MKPAPLPPKHSVSVAGIVVDPAGRVLTIQRADNGHWEPPGGVLERSETLEDGVRREILEETGVTVAVERLTGVYQNLTKGVVALVYRCRAIAGTPHPTPEARDVRWMNLDEVAAEMGPVFAVRVFDAFEASARSRTHDGIRLC